MTTVSKTGWKKRKVHEGVTLPSGAVVDIRLPNLAQLIKSGEIPNQLIDEALEQRNQDKITRETLEKTWAFTRFIVPRTLVKPEISDEDVEDLPIQDVEMLAAFATRSLDIDAVGHHLGGLETVQSFRSHRGLITLDEIVGDLSGSGEAAT